MSALPKLRKYERVALPKGALVAWDYLGYRKVSKVTVLAVGGLFIATPEPPPAGDFIKLVFDVPGGEIRARARVCDSRRGKGMGIQFTTMGPDARARLVLLMKKLTKA
jgi:hypothetical protein